MKRVLKNKEGNWEMSECSDSEFKCIREEANYFCLKKETETIVTYYDQESVIKEPEEIIELCDENLLADNGHFAGYKLTIIRSVYKDGEQENKEIDVFLELDRLKDNAPHAIARTDKYGEHMEREMYEYYYLLKKE